MEFNCNVTTVEARSQINSTSYNLVKMVSMCVSCSLHTLLSVPLLVVIARSPSLLRHARFLLLTHILLCDTLQVDLFLSTALALDRFVAVKWPLRYDFLLCPQRRRAIVAAIWTLSAALCGGASAIGLRTVHASFALRRCRPHILAPCLSGTSTLMLYCMAGTAAVVPLCFVTILGCFWLLCWDMYSGLLLSRRACVTLSLQATQMLLFSIPVVMDSYLIPGHLHSDFLDIATTITYNLGVSLIPLVYGYRSRELQRRIRQAAHWSADSNT